MSYDVLTADTAILWPHIPDWSAGFNVKRSFATDIFDSRDNTEQRRATRFDPRFHVGYRAPLLTAAETREANSWLRRSQNKPTIIPDFARWARLTSASAAASSTLTIAPLPAWVGVDRRLVLCGSTMEEVQVASIAGDDITLVDPLVGTWGIGSVLRPTFHGLLDGRIGSSRRNKAAAEISIEMDVYPGGDAPRSAGTAWASIGSREVFTLQPDYASQLGIDYLWPVESVDFDRGRTAQFRPVDTPQRAIKADFSALGVTATAEVEQFFDRMKGRRTAFYLPTWEQDGVYVADVSNTITLAGTDLAQQFSGFDFATYEFGIAVCLPDGTDHYRRIQSIGTSSGDSLVTLTTPWSVGMSDATSISLMPLVRFASDEMTTSWITPLASRVGLAFQSVRR